jgi:hypothetical protein
VNFATGQPDPISGAYLSWLHQHHIATDGNSTFGLGAIAPALVPYDAIVDLVGGLRAETAVRPVLPAFDGSSTSGVLVTNEGKTVTLESGGSSN